MIELLNAELFPFPVENMFLVDMRRVGVKWEKRYNGRRSPFTSSSTFVRAMYVQPLRLCVGMRV